MGKVGVIVSKIHWGALGVIVAIFAAAVALKTCQLQEKSLEMSATQRAPTTQEEQPFLSILPEDILKDVYAHPPLQHQVIGKSYSGNRVDWLLVLRSATEETDGQVIVFLSSLSSPQHFVHGKVKLADYPWLKIANYESQVRVRGTISDIGTFGIELADIKLEPGPESY